MAPIYNHQNRKKQPKRQSDSVLEQLRDIGGNVQKTVTHDLFGQGVDDAFGSMFGQFPQSGEFRPNSPYEYDYGMEKPFTPQRPIFNEEEHRRKVEADQIQIRQQLEAIRTELKALAVSIKKFHREVDQAITEMPVNPGIYHINFLERLRLVIKQLRQNVDDGSSWLAAFSGRKQKRKYWGMYKKHGTTFGLSQERTASTQSG